MSDTNDILAMMDSDDKPFSEHSTTDTNTDNNTDSSENKKIDLWKDTDIPKVKINPSTVHKVDKSYAIFIHKTDAGIPKEVGEKLLELTKALATKGFIFRYNGDNDPIFKDILNSDSIIVDSYLPWKKFNTDAPNVKMVRPVEQAYKHASYYHKGFPKLPNNVRTILARDVHVLLGEDCRRAVSFMIAYTSDGCESKDKINFKTTGNVSFPIAIAEEVNIPIFNIKNEDAISRLIEYLKTLN